MYTSVSGSCWGLHRNLQRRKEKWAGSISCDPLLLNLAQVHHHALSEEHQTQGLFLEKVHLSSALGFLAINNNRPFLFSFSTAHGHWSLTSDWSVDQQCKADVFYTKVCHVPSKIQSIPASLQSDMLSEPRLDRWKKNCTRIKIIIKITITNVW